VASANDVIGYVNVVLFGLLGVAALRRWRERSSEPSLWIAVAFGDLALVVLIARFLPAHERTLPAAIAGRLVVIGLLLFPYLLYRFIAALEGASPRAGRIAALATLALVVATAVLPHFPQSGEKRPSWFVVYLVAFLIEWALLSILVGIRLWRAGQGQPGVARNRMRMLSAAAGLITVALIIAAGNRSGGSALQLASSTLALASAFAFLLGIAPPAVVRALWRRPEQERLREAINRLVSASTPKEVVDDVLPPMADLVGARAVALSDERGAVLGRHRVGRERGADPVEAAPVRVPVAGGTLDVWTNPYAPFFGTEEFALLRTLGAMTGVALDRTRLFVEEQATRRELERANELKATFVALAAHELRTPVTSVHGIVETLDRLEGALEPEQRLELRQTLRTQSERMRQLIEQLLDLSRLDAHEVPVAPVSLDVRAAVEGLVETTAERRAPDVALAITPDLEANVDPTVFERIVSNLLVNALRHGRPPILVRASRSDNHFRLAVEDRGDGVPDEFVPDLFERFTRSDASRARGLGSGLGLAIARSYARAHGGDLIYERAEPCGARFEFVVPQA
jgi:signal transduction histidine kinase